MDQAQMCFTMPTIGNGNRKMLNPMAEIVRAIQWVNDPQVLGLRDRLLALFSQNGMIGKCAVNFINDVSFRFQVSLRDKIPAGFVLDLVVFAKVTVQSGCSASGSAPRNFQFR